MEFRDNKIKSEKILSELDKFTIEFLNILEKYAQYVIVSGYVSIILGRSRASEDVDLLIPPMEFSQFKDLFEDLASKGFECANTSIVDEAYEMLDEHAIRFYKGIPVPNIEFKKISNDIHKYAFENRMPLELKEKTLFISPLELQIAYKLYLTSDDNFEDISSDKDFEDAKHIYETFKEKLNKDKLLYFVNLFDVKRKFEWLIK